jgi:hypothetical protein
MAQRGWLPFGPATAVAVLVAAGLGIWAAERAADALGLGDGEHAGSGRGPSASASGARRATDRAGAARRAPVQYVPAPVLTFGGSGAEPGSSGIQLKGGALGDASTPGEPGVGADAAGVPAEERSAAAGLLDGLARLIRDLEWTPGLPEPKQQTIIPGPDPWRPPEGAAAAPSPEIEGIEPGSGPVAGGAQIVIRGKHLRPASVVFGYAPAQIVSASPAAVVVVAPRGSAGPVSIAVTNDDGTFAIADQRFTYAAQVAASESSR